jgi:hypothetical protein
MCKLAIYPLSQQMFKMRGSDVQIAKDCGKILYPYDIINRTHKTKI